MKEAFAITGFVAASVAKKLAPKTQGLIEVKPERGQNDVYVSVDGADVDEVRVGATSRGETLVQLILRDNATTRTIIRSVASSKGLERFHDPALARLTTLASPKTIMI
jgi:hypothetical protein